MSEKFGYFPSGQIFEEIFPSGARARMPNLPPLVTLSIVINNYRYIFLH